jgi:hypothetical protein
MKTTLKTLAAALVMVPALAFAGSDSMTVHTTSDSDMATYRADVISDGSIMTTDTTTTTVKRQRNARSDTEYGANSPSPGETDTRVFVRERVRFERNAE